MRALADFSVQNTGQPVFCTLYGPDGAVLVPRTNVGIMEQPAASGLYAVTITDALLRGASLVWDIDGTTKRAAEVFPDTPSYADVQGVPADTAALVLADPANKLATDASGRVTPDTVTPATNVSGIASDAADAKAAAETVAGLVETADGHDRFKASALETAAADLSTVTELLGTPAGDSMSDDIAALTADVQTIDAKVGSGVIVVTSPVTPQGDVGPLIQGDDYAEADGREIAFTNEEGSWVDLTGATVVAWVDFPTPLEYPATVITPTGENQHIHLEDLTRTQTAVMPAGVHDYQLVATLAPSGRVVTLKEGPWSVRSRIT